MLKFRDANYLLWEEKFADITVKGYRLGNYTRKYLKEENLSVAIKDVMKKFNVPFNYDDGKLKWHLGEPVDKEMYNLAGLNILASELPDVEFIIE